MNTTPIIPSHVWQIVGTHAGPSVVILGGTHGDELTGVEVVRLLLKLFKLETFPAGSYPSTDILGDICFAFGNPVAIDLRQRSASGGRDLNRCFIQSELDRVQQKDDSLDLRRAREIAPLLARAQFVFDLHGTSSDSPPFVCFGKDSPRHRDLYRLLPVRYVLTDPFNIISQDDGLGERGTTDAYVEAHGGLELAYETGKEDDLTHVHGVYTDMIRLLQAVGSIAPECQVKDLTQSSAVSTGSQEVFALAYSAQARDSDFCFDSGLDTGWQMVEKGQRLGCYGNGEIEYAPETGMLIFPKAAKKITKGKNFYYLAKSCT